MTEKRIFIFLICNSLRQYQRNNEISKLYMNRIAIDEDDQLEIFKIQNLKIRKIHRKICITEESKTLIKHVLDHYQAEVRRGKKVFKKNLELFANYSIVFK